MIQAQEVIRGWIEIALYNYSRYEQACERGDMVMAQCYLDKIEYDGQQIVETARASHTQEVSRGWMEIAVYNYSRYESKLTPTIE